MAYVIKQKNNQAVIAEGTPSDGSTVLLEGNWYFSPDHVNMSHLKVTDRTYTCPYKGVCYWIDLDTPNAKARNIGWVYNNPMAGYEVIKDKIGFYPRDTAGTVAVRVETTEVETTETQQA